MLTLPSPYNIQKSFSSVLLRICCIESISDQIIQTKRGIRFNDSDRRYTPADILEAENLRSSIRKQRIIYLGFHTGTNSVYPPVSGVIVV